MPRDILQLARKFRLPALFCALAVLLCELASRPYVEMWVADDGSYVRMAQHLAATGHIVYDGWANAMLGWQLYLGAAFIKLFGFSFTTVRMSTLFIAMATAFLLQRTLVRAGIAERNATIGTLALVLSPLYLMLSVTFMTDITGLFSLVTCLYGCLRALKAATSRAAIAWLCFAVASNAVCGSSRQIAWLGVLVMVPSTLWLFRAQRRVLIAGGLATFAGVLFIAGCMLWFKHQPYTLTEQLLVNPFPLSRPIKTFVLAFFDLPFLLLPLVALFFPEIRRNRPRTLAIIAILSAVYLFLACYPSHLRDSFVLEPTMGDWVDAHGIYDRTLLLGEAPLFLHRSEQAALTILSIGGLIGLVSSLLHWRGATTVAHTSAGVSWKQLGVVLGPFTLAYIFLLIPRAEFGALLDRYVLALLVVALLCMVRYYEEQIQPRLPAAGLVLIVLMAVVGIAMTHNLFALYRARVVLAAEIRAAGVPDTSVYNGNEYNFAVEIEKGGYINEARIHVPADAYKHVPPSPPGHCQVNPYTPHICPIYGVSFDPNAYLGPAPFAPVHYSRWLAPSPGALYVVRIVAQP